MYFTLGFLIDTALLCVLLAWIAKIDVLHDVMRPLAVVLMSSVAGGIVSVLLRGDFSFVVSLAAYFVCLYYALYWLFDLDSKKRWTIVGIFVGIRILWSLVLLLAAMMS